MRDEWTPKTGAEAVFEPFVQKALAVFSFLPRAGFGAPSVRVHPPECALAYKRDSLRLTVYFEYGDMPWIKVDERLRGRWSASSLEKWASVHCPESKIDRNRFKDWSDALEKYGSLLQSCLKPD